MKEFTVSIGIVVTVECGEGQDIDLIKGNLSSEIVDALSHVKGISVGDIDFVGERDI